MEPNRLFEVSFLWVGILMGLIDNKDLLRVLMCRQGSL